MPKWSWLWGQAPPPPPPPSLPPPLAAPSRAGLCPKQSGWFNKSAGPELGGPQFGLFKCQNRYLCWVCSVIESVIGNAVCYHIFVLDSILNRTFWILKVLILSFWFLWNYFFCLISSLNKKITNSIFICSLLSLAEPYWGSAKLPQLTL